MQLIGADFSRVPLILSVNVLSPLFPGFPCFENSWDFHLSMCVSYFLFIQTVTLKFPLIELYFNMYAENTTKCMLQIVKLLDDVALIGV